MADQTTIEWTDHTFSPWRGCAKVSPGCDHCYADVLSKRNPAVLGEWGKDANRVIAAEAYWRKPLRWEREAAAFEAEHGRRQRVFANQLGDVFENRPDLAAPRLRLLDLIRRTPSLDWQLLTKRPKNVLPLLRRAYEDANAECNDPADDGSDWEEVEEWLELVRWLDCWITGDYVPENVWLGTSVEDQERAAQRVPALLKVPAAVRFLSMEPLLGPVNLSAALDHYWCPECDHTWAPPGMREPDLPRDRRLAPCCSICSADVGRDVRMYRRDGIDWVIVGGESGHGARPMHPDWARSLRDQCTEAGVPFLFKQWGAHAPADCIACEGEDRIEGAECETCGSVIRAGWPPMLRVGKKASGRQLDGRTHDGFPSSPAGEVAP